MAVAFDAATNGGAGGFTHTPVGTPLGVLVLIRMLNATDQVTSVTYGGVACAEVALSPLVASGAEGGTCYGYFLGTGIPTGAQTCTVNVAAGTPRATCYTVTAATDTEVVDTTTLDETGVTGDRTGTLSLGGRTCFAAEAIWSGAGAVTGVNPLANWTARQETDEGSETNYGYSYDTIGSADITFGANLTVTDDIAILAVAISEVAGGATYTLDAAAAAYAYTASDSSLELGRQLIPDAASYDWAVNDVDLVYTPAGTTYSLDADVAAYLWIANDTDLTYSGQPAAPGLAPAPGGIGHRRKRRRILLDDGRIYEPATEGEFRAYVESVIVAATERRAALEAPPAEAPARVKPLSQQALAAVKSAALFMPPAGEMAGFYKAVDLHTPDVLTLPDIQAAWAAYQAELDDEDVTLLLLS